MNFDENDEFEPNDELILIKSEENDSEILQEPILLSDSEDLGNASLGIPFFKLLTPMLSEEDFFNEICLQKSLELAYFEQLRDVI